MLKEWTQPRHSSLVLIFTMSVTLLATYTILVPGLIRIYEKKIEKEQQKLETVITRIELHQEMLDKAVREMAKIHSLGNENHKLLQELKNESSNNRTTRSKNQ